MTSTVDQAVLAGFAGGVMAVASLVLARRGLLRLRYALGWLALSGCVVAVALLVRALRPLAGAFGVSPTGLLLLLASGVLLVITLQLSIAVSGLRDDVQTVAEAHALLEARVRDLEEGRAAASTQRPDTASDSDAGDRR